MKLANVQTSLLDMLEDSEEYDEFTEKFRPKKTTDDCLTPPEVYEVVAGYVAERYGLDRDAFVRPFWPGGDYRAFDYPTGCVVVDNPPFSILARICHDYMDNGIRFWLFAPTMTCLNASGRKHVMETNHVVCAAQVTYENGAVVPTSFVTNLDADGTVLEANTELSARLGEVCDRLAKAKTKKLPKYVYPDHVVTAAKCSWLSKHGTSLKVNRRDCAPISKLDASTKEIFGGGLLLSERAAAERAAAERAAAERAAAVRWQLSEREKEIVRRLGKRGEG